MRIRSTAAFALISSLFLLIGCSGKPADYYTLKPIDINYNILASCSVKYPKPLDMTASASGKILRVAIQEGDIVKKGQLLVQMDDVVEQQNLSIARKTLDSTIMKIKNSKDEEYPKLIEQETQYKSDLQNAQNDVNRSQQLFESGTISRSDLENAQNRYQKALSTYNQIKLSLDSYAKSGPLASLADELIIQQAQVELAKKALEDKKITAPFEGTVAKLNIQNGERVQAGASVVTVIEKSPWVMESEVDQKDLPFLGTHLTAVISFDAYPQDKVTADITYICTLIDSQKGTCNLKFEIKEKKSFIKYGMSGTAQINAGFYKQKLALPSRFVERADGNVYAWLWNGKSAERTRLDTETIGEKWIVVKNEPEGSKFLIPGPGTAKASKLGKEVANP